MNTRITKASYPAMSTETFITDAKTAVATAEATIKELQSYLADTKAELKESARRLREIETVTKTYAPRVVSGVKWLNKNVRGWATNLMQIDTTNGTFLIPPTPAASEWVALGFEPDPKVEAKCKEVDSDEILTVLWQAAQDIQIGKKAVTEARLLKRVGL